MKEQRFWKVIAVAGLAVGLYIGHGLHQGKPAFPSPSAYADEVKQDESEKGPKLTWEGMNWDKKLGCVVNRSKVPGGWLLGIRVQAFQSGAELSDVEFTFLPDPDHKWDGRSLP